MAKKFISTYDVAFFTLVALSVLSIWHLGEKTSSKDLIQIERVRNAITAENAQEIAQVALDYIAANKRNNKKAQKAAFEKLETHIVERHHGNTNQLQRTLTSVNSR